MATPASPGCERWAPGSLSVALFLLVAFGASGCSQPLLLKKYQATAPRFPELAGRAVYVESLVNQRTVDWAEPGEPLTDPAKWKYREMSPGILEQWERDRRAAEAAAKQAPRHKVGQARNGFGMPISEVLALNTPEQWLTEAIRLELHAQGAQLVGTPEEAEVVVRGELRQSWLEIFVAAMWVHLVLDLTTLPRGSAARTVHLFVGHAAPSWSGTDAESFETFCAAEQKLQIHVLNEVRKAALAALPATPAL